VDELAPVVPGQVAEGFRSGFVAVIGKPNVGKSTLINAYVGQKLSIVSPKPQTTRRNLLGILTEGRYQVVFVDTPGVHAPLHKLGETMVQAAAGAAGDADLVLWLVDGSAPPDDEDRAIAALLQSRNSPILLVLNKMDLTSPISLEQRLPAFLELGRFVGHVAVSATRGDRRQELLDLVVSLLPEGPQYFPAEQITDADERFVAAELVREQVLQHLRQEVPHAVAVLIDEFKDRTETLSYIAATIAVERDSQRQIVIGKGGAMLKLIGAAARKEIEESLGRKVYLELWVKVIPKWRRDPEQLRRMGYTLPDRRQP
jgi:GTPase